MGPSGEKILPDGGRERDGKGNEGIGLIPNGWVIGTKSTPGFRYRGKLVEFVGLVSFSCLVGKARIPRLRVYYSRALNDDQNIN